MGGVPLAGAYRDFIHRPGRRTPVSLAEVEKRQADFDSSTRCVVALISRPFRTDGAHSLTNDVVGEPGHFALRRRE